MKKGVFEGDYPFESKVTIITGNTYIENMASLYAQNQWLVYLLAITDKRDGISR